MNGKPDYGPGDWVIPVTKPVDPWIRAIKEAGKYLVQELREFSDGFGVSFYATPSPRQVTRDPYDADWWCAAGFRKLDPAIDCQKTTKTPQEVRG